MGGASNPKLEALITKVAREMIVFYNEEDRAGWKDLPKWCTDAVFGALLPPCASGHGRQSRADRETRSSRSPREEGSQERLRARIRSVLLAPEREVRDHGQKIGDDEKVGDKISSSSFENRRLAFVGATEACGKKAFAVRAAADRDTRR